MPVHVLDPVPAPVSMLWPPTMLPLDGPPPLQREIVQAPFSAIPLDRDYINLGSHPIPLVSSSAVYGNAPDAYAHPYRSAGHYYNTKINHQHDPPQLRLDLVDSSLLTLAPSQAASRVTPYAPRMSNFDLPTSSGDARLGEKHPIRAPNTLSGYVNRISQPVSSRYLFAGPSTSYGQGRAS